MKSNATEKNYCNCSFYIETVYYTLWVGLECVWYHYEKTKSSCTELEDQYTLLRYEWLLCKIRTYNILTVYVLPRVEVIYHNLFMGIKRISTWSEWPTSKTYGHALIVLSRAMDTFVLQTQYGTQMKKNPAELIFLFISKYDVCALRLFSFISKLSQMPKPGEINRNHETCAIKWTQGSGNVSDPLLFINLFLIQPMICRCFTLFWSLRIVPIAPPLSLSVCLSQ